MIPARYKSTRFPGKPLADLCGKPLMWWVFNQARKVREFKKVYVATDDNRIARRAKELDMPVIMTCGKHKTGTDRVGEVARRIKADIYVNIQGDEPLLHPDTIRSAIRPFFAKRTGFEVTNLMLEIKRMSELMSTTVPKAAVNADDMAVFLSRLPIPYRKGDEVVKYYKQVCVYAFTKDALSAFCRLKRGPCERAEDIELLRFIENSIPVRMVRVRRDSMAVDTPRDLEQVRKILSAKMTKRRS